MLAYWNNGPRVVLWPHSLSCFLVSLYSYSLLLRIKRGCSKYQLYGLVLAHIYPHSRKRHNHLRRQSGYILRYMPMVSRMRILCFRVLESLNRDGAGLHSIPEHLSSPSVFSVVRVTRSIALCVCFVDRRLTFSFFSFGHCVVCPSYTDSDYPILYLQTLLINSTNINRINHLSTHLITVHKETMVYDVGHPGPGFWQAQKCGEVKLVNCIPCLFICSVSTC